MDLAHRTIANIKELTPEAFTLAQAIEAEISDKEWIQFRKIYCAAKQRATEEADLDQIEVHFSPEALEPDASMIGYYEIFPYAKHVEFTLGADTWIFDDQYCLKPKCHCHDTDLSFIRPPLSFAPGDSPTKANLSVRYDYVTGRIEVIPGPDDNGVSAHALINALKSAEPCLNSLLAKRHATLRKIYKRALSLKTVRLPTSKPGRNDPCPCGSGKKYKKCCGV